ncbi:hypothetical protein [Haloferula sp. A504]|uniref:hypothetical protein n=1 Tax=Haloferula sp. A504 TaxID=3373601 RepID=UPI0031BE5D12|nr:hypothetical protein [Verrucomicrobiaceae bacterium E54]
MIRPIALIALATVGLSPGQTVFISRMWHNHQPLYWPEWNTNGGETNRVEYAWDSITLKPLRGYAGSPSQHPENNLGEIFGKADRVVAYQNGPRASLENAPGAAFCVSYSGSLIDNVRQLGAGGHLSYGPGWWDGNRTARNWTTPSGSRRLDLVGFTYHHSLAPLLPKEVFRKELRIFKQAWWKAWGGNSDLSDHSKGFFPTEMAFSRHLVDVLVDEGYDWSIVASHHLSRTCPTYFNQFDLGNDQYNINSSPPNRADLLGPSPTTGWWRAEPNPGNAAWNVSPFAYQLHRVEYVDPETGNTKSMIAVPSDDVLSYQYGYSNAGVGNINDHIAPHATDPARPALVMPTTDGDNAWGGGNDSWMNATKQFFESGYTPTAVQDFVNAHGAAAGTVHIEDGAWIFPTDDYGSPYFLKWIEPPLGGDPAKRYPGTIAELESPGFALKFWAWAPVITGANWCETAEQVLEDEGGSVEAWKIQAPYDWDGSWTNPNDVELAWHIYLGGLDSGFNYYGGLGNDDEVKAALATTRTIEKLQPFMTPERRAQDRTPPSVLKPQRFPYNPGAHTFGWFNRIPGGDERYLKEMPSEFYVWTHAYDLSGVERVELKVRVDGDGINSMATVDNETYSGGSEVGSWITIPMTRRVLPNDQGSLNAAANHGEINYFITPPELADYYFARITDAEVPDFRGKLLDYHIEAEDQLGNIHKSEIQHVFVEDDGGGEPVDPPAIPDGLVVIEEEATSVRLDWNDVDGATSYVLYRDGHPIGSAAGSGFLDQGLAPLTSYDYHVVARNSGGDSAPSATVTATTTAATGPLPFIMDGFADFPGYLLSDPGMTLYAAVRGSTLYLATWAPGEFGNDHHILVGSSLEATANQPAPWAKAGLTALPADSPFIGAEGDNDYIVWSNAGNVGTTMIRGSRGGQMEATIDLVDAFGTVPATVHLAALAYQSPDGGLLASQAPAPVINDDNLDPDEFLGIPVEALRDENADGLYDRLDPRIDFVTTGFAPGTGGHQITWNCFPGCRYQIESSPDLGPDNWTPVPEAEVTAGPLDLSLSHPVAIEGTRRFYRVRLLP